MAHNNIVTHDLRNGASLVHYDYAELEREHVIEVVRGRGTFVTRQPSVPNAEIRIRELRESVLRLAIEAYHLQIQGDELIDMLNHALAELHGEKRLGGDES